MKNYLHFFYIKYAAIICCFSLGISSCKKLIEIPPNPPNQIPTAILFADSIGAMSALAGVYNSFSPSVINFNSGAITIATGLTSDELVTITTGNSSDLAMQGNSILTSDNKVSGLWQNAYVSISRINSFLEGVSASTAISQGLKQQLIGEAKVSRAWCFFQMVNIFGAFPMVTTTDYKLNASLPRTSVDSIYDQIIRDLTDAQGRLVAGYPSAGRARPNLYMASALLAKVYLYRGRWQDAENMATSVIGSGLYSLPALGSTFLDGSTEAIWQLPPNGTNAQTAEGFNFIPTAANKVPTYSLSGFLLNAFETGDLRKFQWTATVTVNTVAYSYPAKYKNRTVSATPLEDYMMMRLSEIYLIRAEARARQNNVTDALSDLQLIRNPTRVGLPIYNGPTDQTSVLNAITHERQVELFCEWGNRWYDLRRTGTIDAVLGTEKTNWQSTDALFPIPLAQQDANPFLTQNPGYN